MRWLEDAERVPPLSELGWDPVLDPQPLPAFACALGGTRRAVKALLLDQGVVAGIGNWCVCVGGGGGGGVKALLLDQGVVAGIGNWWGWWVGG